MSQKLNMDIQEQKANCTLYIRAFSFWRLQEYEIINFFATSMTTETQNMLNQSPNRRLV